MQRTRTPVPHEGAFSMPVKSPGDGSRRYLKCLSSHVAGAALLRRFTFVLQSYKKRIVFPLGSRRSWNERVVMGSRTDWFVVSAVIALRNQELVQYAQDDIKLETRPGVNEHQYTFILEVDEFSNEDLLRTLVLIKLNDIFGRSPKLEDTKDSPRFEVKSLSFTKAKFVFHVVTTLK